MTKQDMIKRMTDLTKEMQQLAAELDPPPSKGGGPKISDVADRQQKWLTISTQLANKIKDPEITRGDIEAVFHEIGMLGVIYIETFKYVS